MKKEIYPVYKDYVTKWVDAKSLFRAAEKSMVEFIYEEIFTRFGVPREIVTNQGAQPIDDDFLDKHLFVVSVQTPWFADIANYLATRKLPNHLSPHEKC